MLIVLQVKYIVLNIHIVYVVETHRMERLTKDFAGGGFFIPISYGHDS